MTGSSSSSRRPSRTSSAAGHRQHAFQQRFVRCTRTRRPQCRKLLEMAVIVLQDYLHHEFRKNNGVAFETLMVLAVAHLFGFYNPKQLADFLEVPHQQFYTVLKAWS